MATEKQIQKRIAQMKESLSVKIEGNTAILPNKKIWLGNGNATAFIRNGKILKLHFGHETPKGVKAPMFCTVKKCYVANLKVTF